MTDTFWTAIERVGSLALLAMVLWAVWKAILQRNKSECERLDKLVQFVQSQVIHVQQLQEANVTAFQGLVEQTLESMHMIIKLVETHESETTHRHSSLAKAVEARQLIILERLDIAIGHIKKLNGEIRDASVDGQMRSGVQKGQS